VVLEEGKSPNPLAAGTASPSSSSLLALTLPRWHVRRGAPLFPWILPLFTALADRAVCSE